MRTVKMKVHVVNEEFDEKGRRYWTEEDKIEEFELKAEGRHHMYCDMCGWPTYPECAKDCSIRWSHPLEK